VRGDRPGSNRRLRGSQPRVLPSTPRPPRNGDDRARTGGLSLDRRVLCSSELRPQEGRKAGSAPRNRRHRRRSDASLPRRQLLPIGTPASACPHRSPLTGSAWRLSEASCTLRPTLCAAVVPSLPRRSVDHRSSKISSAGGIRTHGLELMRLAGTAAPLPRKVWPAGVEPAISGARSRWGGQLPYDQPIDTPGRIRTGSFRVEGPASSPLRPRGRELRRQGSNLRFTVNSRASFRSTTPE
jgi:hypothetical protein